MNTPWYPKALKRSWAIDGGSMVGGPPRGILHETQTTSLPSYNGGRTAPHLTLDRDGQFYQHIPFNRAARALYNQRGGVQTNRQGSVNIQIEVVAYSDKSDWTTEQVKALREFMQWAEDEWGIPFFFPRALGSPRMTPLEWLEFTGWGDHGMVPENVHWDVGTESAVQAIFDPSVMLEDMFVALGDKGDQVEFWQRLIMKLDSSLLPRFGADGDYGQETVAAVQALVPSSDGNRVGPAEAVALLSKLSSGGPAGPQGPPGPQGPRGPMGPPGPEPEGPWVLEIRQV